MRDLKKIAELQKVYLLRLKRKRKSPALKRGPIEFPPRGPLPLRAEDEPSEFDIGTWEQAQALARKSQEEFRSDLYERVAVFMDGLAPPRASRPIPDEDRIRATQPNSRNSAGIFGTITPPRANPSVEGLANLIVGYFGVTIEACNRPSDRHAYLDNAIDWLRSPDGRVYVHKRWLLSKEGQKWLQSEKGKEWLQSEEGREWKASKGNRLRQGPKINQREAIRIFVGDESLHDKNFGSKFWVERKNAAKGAKKVDFVEDKYMARSRSRKKGVLDVLSENEALWVQQANLRMAVEAIIQQINGTSR